MRTLKLLAAAVAIAVTSPVLAAPGTIPVVATQAGQFTTLVAALKAAGLVDTLAGKGPFTVFAPTDAAFAKLPAGTVKSLLEPANKAKLTSILTYHVVPGKTLSTALAGKTLTVKTVEGASLKIDATGSSVKVNNATVIGADVAASNGVIHVIDTVLMPPM
ncbi:MAG: fasciclin domain-containing protein [Polymorphobacter sp.]